MSSKSGKTLNTNYGRLFRSGGSKKRPLKRAKLRQSQARIQVPADNENMDSGAESESQSEDAESAIATDKKEIKLITVSSQKVMLSMFVTICVVTSGLSNYLTSPIGGGKSASFVDKLAKQVFALLYFTKLALDGTGFNIDDDSEFVGEVWSTALAIVTGETSSIADHLENLRTKRGLKDLTFSNYICLYKLFYYWFAFVFKDRGLYAMSDEDKRKMEVTFQNLGKFYGKAAKVVFRKSRLSIEERVALNSWPEGGYADLQLCLIPHIKALLAMDPATIRIDEESYRHIKQVLISGIYAFSVQGRIGGVKSILLRQARGLIENGKRRSIININYR
jgi:hypothetical protein